LQVNSQIVVGFLFRPGKEALLYYVQQGFFLFCPASMRRNVAGFSLLERSGNMKVLTKRASEQVMIDQPVRLIVLKTGTDKVELGLLDRGEDVRRTFSDPDRPSEKRVKVIAPFGEEIEIDG